MVCWSEDIGPLVASSSGQTFTRRLDGSSSAVHQGAAYIALAQPFEPQPLARRSVDSTNLDGFARSDNERRIHATHFLTRPPQTESFALNSFP